MYVKEIQERLEIAEMILLKQKKHRDLYREELLQNEYSSSHLLYTHIYNIHLYLFKDNTNI